MATTECYAMVRGSAVRVTGLGRRGSIPETIQYAVSKAVAKVTINEVVETGSSELLASDDNDNDNRVRLNRADESIRYTVDMDFLRVDPGLLNLITGVPLVYKGRVLGFGEAPFGEAPFGGPSLGFGIGLFGETPFGGTEGIPTENFPVVGFDSDTRLPPVSFALEVWSKLAGQYCASTIPAGFDDLGFDEGPFGGEGPSRRYGYTVFPFLRGGRLTGFRFENGLVSFNIRGAQTRKAPRWAVGPYDLEGGQRRLLTPVSGNTMFRQMLTTALPPLEDCGIIETQDVIDGGIASVTSEDILDGGSAASTSPWIVEGGRAL